MAVGAWEDEQLDLVRPLQLRRREARRTRPLGAGPCGNHRGQDEEGSRLPCMTSTIDSEEPIWAMARRRLRLT